MRHQEKTQIYEHILKCVQDGELEALQKLFEEHSSDIVWSECVQMKSRDSCLHLAAREGHAKLLCFLLESGAQICLEFGNKDGKRPAHEAAHFSHPECLQILIQAGCDVDALKRADWTPLMLACTRSDSSVVSLLLSAGALPLLTNKDGWTAAQLAARAGELRLLQMLLEKEPRLKTISSKTGRTLLHTAALAGRLNVVQFLMDHHHLPVDATDSSLCTPLMDASRGGHLATAEYLLSRGADVRCTDRLGRHVLHSATQTGELEIVTLVLKKLAAGVSTEQRGEKGERSVVSMPRRGEDFENDSTEVTNTEDDQVRLSCGADQDNKPGADAVEKAALRLHQAVSIRLHGESDRFVDNYDHKGSSARLETVDVNSVSGDGSTALHTAAREGHMETCQMLLEWGADSGVRDCHGRSPADLAAIHGHHMVADMLRGYEGKL